jgi:hypothetical protein
VYNFTVQAFVSVCNYGERTKLAILRIYENTTLLYKSVCVYVCGGAVYACVICIQRCDIRAKFYILRSSKKNRTECSNARFRGTRGK